MFYSKNCWKQITLQLDNREQPTTTVACLAMETGSTGTVVAVVFVDTLSKRRAAVWITRVRTLIDVCNTKYQS